MPRGRWGTFVCSCRGQLPVDPEGIGEPAPVTAFGTHPDADAAGFAEHAAAQGVDHVLVACCMGTEPFRQAFRAAGRAPHLYAADLTHCCFRAHAGPAESQAKARRVLRAEMWAAGQRVDVRENPLVVGRQVLLFTDDPAGLRLASRLRGDAQVIVFVHGSPDAFDGTAAQQVNRGRLKAVEGRLGALRAVMETPDGNGGGTPRERALMADQIVVAGRREASAIKRRTGVHLLDALDEGALAAAADAVRDLTGRFLKPEHVTYDARTCAGGAVQHQACGRCIEACPYEAIGRDGENPLRVRVDHLTCEGCGACTAACPTSSLQFTEPTPGEIHARLGGLLAEDSGPDDGNATDGHAPVVVFHCSVTGRDTLALAAERGLRYGANALPVEVPCLRHVSPAYLLAAFRMGAGGAALLGCETCPHGERTLLHETLAFTGQVLDAFGMDSGRVRLITGDRAAPGPTVAALDAFLREAPAAMVPPRGRRYHPPLNRASIADTLGTFMEATGREPGPVAVARGQPVATPEVHAEGCTLCRSCANVCPTHAFRFNGLDQTLTLKRIDCVACGLCERVCPESVITLQPEVRLQRAALEHEVVARDEQIACIKCGKPYINKRALERVQGFLFNMTAQLEHHFAGERRDLLRMCPDCRAVAAMEEVQQGWDIYSD